MRSNSRIKLCLAGVVSVLVVFIWVLTVCCAGRLQAEQAVKPADRKPNVNSLCYVCHLDLQTEEITTVHLENDVTCDECHGPSVPHMDDEMLMTKPDRLFGRAEVEPMCKTCHDPCEAHMDAAAMEAFRKKWFGRTRPNGRAITAESVCTDCHGTHNIVKQMGSRDEKERADEWVAAFNGRNLAGWRTSGGASWAVKRGCIVATTGPKGQSGDLWTKAMYEDYRLSVTFRATWPIHAGIWLRAAEPERGPRVEVFESHKASAFTGSVWVPGKGVALANLREELVDREGWNTISVEIRGNRVGVWLNGEEVGAVRIIGPVRGRIGLHIERGAASKAGELCVREVLVQRLGEPAEKMSKASQN